MVTYKFPLLHQYSSMAYPLALISISKGCWSFGKAKTGVMLIFSFSASKGFFLLSSPLKALLHTHQFMYGGCNDGKFGNEPSPVLYCTQKALNFCNIGGFSPLYNHINFRRIYFRLSTSNNVTYVNQRAYPKLKLQHFDIQFLFLKNIKHFFNMACMLILCPIVNKNIIQILQNHQETTWKYHSSPS